MIRRSSTPDVLQTPLSRYQFKNALSRKSAPLPSHRSGVPDKRLENVHFLSSYFTMSSYLCFHNEEKRRNKDYSQFLQV